MNEFISTFCGIDGSDRCFEHPVPCPSFSIKSYNPSGVVKFYRCQSEYNSATQNYDYYKEYSHSAPLSDLGVLYRNDNFGDVCSCAGGRIFAEIDKDEKYSTSITMSATGIYPNWTYKLRLILDVRIVSISNQCPQIDNWSEETQSVEFDFELTTAEGDLDRRECPGGEFKYTIGVNENGDVLIGEDFVPDWFINKFGDGIWIENPRLVLVGVCNES